MLFFLSLVMFIAALMSGLSWLESGRFPRHIFRWLCSWWWPHRPKADAGVLIYQAVMAVPDKFQVSYDGLSGCLKNKRIRVDNPGYSSAGRYRVSAGNISNIPISAWGDFKLHQAVRFLNRKANRKASNSRTVENQARYVEGTRQVAQILADGLRAIPKPELEEPKDTIAEFETQARFMSSRYGENELDNMLQVEHIR